MAGRAHVGPGDGRGWNMTNTFDERARQSAPKGQGAPKERGRLSRGLLGTIPIVLAGSMAMSLNVTGPIQSVDARRTDKSKSTPSEIGKTIRVAFPAATRAATNPVAPVVSDASTEVAASAPATYRVVAGDTISGIAGRFGLATASVLALNGLGWKSVIFAGQTLKLTSGGAVPVVKAPVSTPTSRYSIQKGDTVGKIAARFGLTAQTLLSANGLGWSSIIYPGQTLAIPSNSTVASVTPTTAVRIVESPAPSTVAPAPVAVRSAAPSTAAPNTYVIGTGDTVAKIAAKFGVTAQTLLTANGLSWSSIIYAGRPLVIPGAQTVVPASATTVVALTPEMAANARVILSVGRSLGVPEYGLVVALAAAAQESGLRNLNFGDRDSLGLFQQRPSTGWGTPAQVLDTTYAARLFFGGRSGPNRGITNGLLDIPGWQSKTVTKAAQSVQLSGFPDAYAKWETSARSWVSALR